MDVGFRSVGTIILTLISLAACSPKTTTSVFNEADYGSQAACAGKALQNRYIVQWEDGHFTVETATTVDKFKKDFLEPNLKNVRKVEYDRVVQFERNTDIVKLADVDPTDYWGQDMIEASSVWGENVFGQNIKVGVIDSFVDTTHPQLWSNIDYNTAEIPGNGIDDDKNGYIDDYAGFTFISNPGTGTAVSDHGTHVAGIIAADSTKGYVKGMAPQAKIVPAPFIDGENGGSIGDAILALQYVSTRGVKIINASWGGAPCMQSLQNAFVELNNKGILVVVAAGNEGTDLDYSPDYPAAFNMANQITVAAGTPSDMMVHWSNSGFHLVHLAAPGVDILSTITNKRVGYMSGTSMAAPFVTGAAALLWSDRPQATAVEVKTALLRSVDVDPARQYKVQTLGRLNVRKALEELRKLVP
ncbi:S8 family peptidase [Bdellovibrio sp. HCB337]|uniref:S8 family peptidase n=1 Tax=Bdellovibrio sp. HCB337 TaxID=3394358 RepID=UPI0039A41383